MSNKAILKRFISIPPFVRNRLKIIFFENPQLKNIFPEMTSMSNKAILEAFYINFIIRIQWSRIFFWKPATWIFFSRNKFYERQSHLKAFYINSIIRMSWNKNFFDQNTQLKNIFSRNDLLHINCILHTPSNLWGCS